MIHYHGTPLGGKSIERVPFMRNRHFFVSFLSQEDLPLISDAAASFAFDNGAFTLWRTGHAATDWRPYMRWVRDWARHPRFAFAIIPDVIDGSEQDNDCLIAEWKVFDWQGRHHCGVPVWHLHESLERLAALVSAWPRVALGSSGEYANPGAPKWKLRMSEAMSVCCDHEGRPLAKLHGLRMLRSDIVERYPFASCDSTNVAQNSHRGSKSPYPAMNQSQERERVSWGIEAAQSPATWVAGVAEPSLFSEATA